MKEIKSVRINSPVDSHDKRARRFPRHYLFDEYQHLNYHAFPKGSTSVGIASFCPVGNSRDIPSSHKN